MQQQEKQQHSQGEHFVALPLPSFPDADFHFNCVKALFLTSEKCVRVRVLIRECKNTACRIFYANYPLNLAHVSRLP